MFDIFSYHTVAKIHVGIECKMEDNHTDTAVKRKSIFLVIGIEGDVERWADMKCIIRDISERKALKTFAVYGITTVIPVSPHYGEKGWWVTAVSSS